LIATETTVTTTEPDLVQITSENVMQVAADILEPVARFLSVAREQCGGDAEKVLVMLGVILRASLHPDYRKLTPQEVETGDFATLPTLGVNLASLSHSTGIAKETVRRKVQELVAMGWVLRKGRNLYYTVDGYRAVSLPREALIRAAVRAFEVERRLMHAAAPDAERRGWAEGEHAAAGS
jgi:hypothetical protein